MDQDQPNPSQPTINNLLVLVTLITSVTFQAGVNPPGGVWPDNSPQAPAPAAPSPAPAPAPAAASPAADTNHTAGKSILANSRVFYGFYIFFNTAAFSTSVSMIGFLVEASGEIKLLLRVALGSMAAAYSTSVMAVLPDNHGPLNLYLLYFAYSLPLLVLFARYVLKKIKAAWDKLW